MIVIKVFGLPKMSQTRLCALHENVVAEVNALSSLELKLANGYVGNRRIVCYFPTEMALISKSSGTIFVEVTIFNETEIPKDVKQKIEPLIKEGVRVTLPDATVIFAVTTYIPPRQFWFMQNTTCFAV